MAEESELIEKPDYRFCPWSYGLPKTGRTTSMRTGDDGDFQKGWDETDRFTVVCDGTIIDNATGLMWPEDWQGVGGNGGNTKTATLAVDWALTVSLCGYSDWRLPNINELFTIVNREVDNPAIYDVFLDVVLARYWSSTSDAANSSYFTFLSWQRGQVDRAFFSTTYNVIAVRNN